MLVGRRELAARYHGYLNKRLKERRVLYVHIEVEGDPSAPAGAAAREDRKIRLKIKSGQSAEWLADMVVKKYALRSKHHATIAATLQEAIDQHEVSSVLRCVVLREFCAVLCCSCVNYMHVTGA